MLKRLFSKRSGFTLVEIIVAFAVFAIMSTMIIQVLNIISVQRRWNNNFSREIDEQEGVLVTTDKLGYTTGVSNDGGISFNFSDGSVVNADYQMKGTGENGSVDGLAYFVIEESEKMTADDLGGEGGAGDAVAGDNTGAQTDRVDARITGTKGFDYISINKVIKVDEYKDESGRTLTVYAFELSAQAGDSMYLGDIPYANYRLYFYDKSGKQAEIVSANYLSAAFSSAADWKNQDAKSKTAISYSTGAVQSVPNGAKNKYTVSITAPNGVRIGSPFSSTSSGGGTILGYKKCKTCGAVFHTYNWSEWIAEDSNGGNQWRQCPASYNNGWYNCNDNLQDYTPPVVDEPEDDDDYSGNGVKFKATNPTRFEVTFVGDPQLTVNSFGENGTGGVYKANATVGGVDCGPNIYGAFPKK